MLLRQFSTWPPLIVGGPVPTGFRFPSSVGGGVLNGIYPAMSNRVTFSCMFEDHELRCHLNVDSVDLAEKIIQLLSHNIGKTVMELGELKVDIA
jgi:hypothetical protein